MRRMAAGMTTSLLLAATQAFAAPPLVGTWFGQGQPQDKGAMYIDRMEAGGAFHAHHRFCRNGKPSDTFVDGTWSVKGDIMTIQIATVDGQPNPRTDEYRVLSVDAGRERYVYLPLNFPYTAKKVGADFAMPSCELVS
jgi:hypothetical protein